VLAVLLTGFMVVFAPAAAGIKKSINAQEADRLASTLELELVTSRGTDPKPGFNKAFNWLNGAYTANTALLVYQYRGSLDKIRDDGTPMPMTKAFPDKSPNQILPGKDYVLQTMVRRQNDALFGEDLVDVEGGVYVAKCKQLVFDSNGQLVAGNDGIIADPKPPNAAASSADLYPEAVIAFSAEFYSVPGKRPNYFTGAFASKFPDLKNPVFTRNLAVRR
jgi:hypothetical protein